MQIDTRCRNSRETTFLRLVIRVRLDDTNKLFLASDLNLSALLLVLFPVCKCDCAHIFTSTTAFLFTRNLNLLRHNREFERVAFFAV